MYYHRKTEYVEIETLIGKTVKSIEGLEEGSDEVHVYTTCGEHYMFFHDQDCCEDVRLNDFDGGPSDLIGGLIVSAEEVSNHENEYDNKENKPSEYLESWTWTFYKIETNKGGLWMRWLGESNGYYSESVDFVKIKD